MRILDHAAASGDVSKTCRYSGIGRACFYRWRHALPDHGETGLANKRSVPHNHPNRTPEAVAEKVLRLRREHHLGPIRIVWYLERYHGLKISDAGVYRILKRNGVKRLPGGTRMRKIHTKRYNKRFRGHQIQMDVKFLIFINKRGAKTKRFQYSAIDDATRICALNIYARLNKSNALYLVDHVIVTLRSACRKSELTTATSSKPSFTGISKTKASATPTSNPVHRNLTARSNNPMDLMSKSSTASKLHQRHRSQRQTGRVGAVLQPRQTSRRPQRENALRGAPRKAIKS